MAKRMLIREKPERLIRGNKCTYIINNCIQTSNSFIRIFSKLKLRGKFKKYAIEYVLFSSKTSAMIYPKTVKCLLEDKGGKGFPLVSNGSCGKTQNYVNGSILPYE